MALSKPGTSRRRSGSPRIDGHQGIVIGSDEAGCGPWAGPLVTCAAAAPIGWDDDRIQDSKLYDRETGEAVREALYQELFPDSRFFFAVSVLDSEVIDRMGVYNAQLYAHAETLRTVQAKFPDALLVVDGSLPVAGFGLGPNIVALPQGDQHVPECSLASIIAKATRDRLMRDLDKKYPGYGFAKHKGYGTPEHEAGLDKLGLCPIHRRSFGPIKKREEAMAAPAASIFELMSALDDD